MGEAARLVVIYDRDTADVLYDQGEKFREQGEKALEFDGT